VRPVASGILFAAASTAVALVVVAVGSLVAEIPDRDSVRAGAGIGLAVQIVSFWALAVWLFPTRRLLVVGLGMGIRMAALLAMVFAAPRLGLVLAPALLTMVSVFVLTTLLEPVLFQLETKRAS